MSYVGGLESGSLTGGRFGGIETGDLDYAIASAIDVLNDDGRPIGFISEIRPAFRQGQTRIYHLNSIDAGTCLDIVPQIEIITLSATGVALLPDRDQFQDLINLLSMKGNVWNLSMIGDYIHVAIRRVKPSDPSVVATTWFERSRINSYDPGAISVTGDLILTQRCDMDVSRVWQGVGDVSVRP